MLSLNLLSSPACLVQSSLDEVLFATFWHCGILAFWAAKHYSILPNFRAVRGSLTSRWGQVRTRWTHIASVN